MRALGRAWAGGPGGRTGRRAGWVGTAPMALALVLAACQGPAPAPPTPEGLPQRAVSFAPAVTEMVFALGQGDVVVGVSDFCDYPPEVAELPRLGGYMNPNLEQMALLQPEIVFVQGLHPAVSEFSKGYAIPLVNVRLDTVADVLAGFETVADALGDPGAGAALRRRVATELDAVRAAVAGRPRPKVLIINTRTSHNLDALFSVGGGAFVSELVAAAGGDNVFADSTTLYFEASKEAVVAAAPEVILEFHAGESLSAAETARYTADWDALPSVPAVAQGRIHLITPSYALRPGPRIGATARLLAGVLHPDAGVDAP